MNTNPILLTDSYKISHWEQYPPGTSNVYSYFESRGGRFDHTVFFGLQYILKEYFTRQVRMSDWEEARHLFYGHFGQHGLFNEQGWKRIINVHDGYLPVEIKAVPEGSRIPVSNVLMTVENTDPLLPWVTNYVETMLSQVWYPCTVATLSNEVRRLIEGYLINTGDVSGLDFKLHDFGFRGVSSLESAAIGGAAHLLSFLGTDTIPPMKFLEDYYGAKQPVGFSIPASEHSTMTSWGRNREEDAYRNMIQKFGDYPLYAVVSDSYDLWVAASQIWGRKLKDDVLDAKGTLVIRPDSGPPALTTNTLLYKLAEAFGYTTNDKGYKVLHPKVRVIWGDGLDYVKIKEILQTLYDNKWSIDNIAFGMGGGLLQQVNRDTQKFAFKCSSATINGQEQVVFKDPVTDSGKVSKRGRLALVEENGKLKTLDHLSQGEISGNLLRTVFKDGKLYNTTTLDHIRKTLKG